jgi:hypothetical protein
MLKPPPVLCFSETGNAEVLVNMQKATVRRKFILSSNAIQIVHLLCILVTETV